MLSTICDFVITLLQTACQHLGLKDQSTSMYPITKHKFFLLDFFLRENKEVRIFLAKKAGKKYPTFSK